MVKYIQHYFVISARHALSKEGFTVSDLFIPHRLQSKFPIQIGRGVSFSPADVEEDDTAAMDIQIHRILEHHKEETDWEPGEYLDITSYSNDRWRFGLQISGFPKQMCGIDYDEDKVWGDGVTFQGEHGGDDSSSAGLALFKSSHLVGLDSNGMSGGAITSEVLGSVELEGIVVQGAGAPQNDFVRFVTIDMIRHQFSQSWESLTRVEQDGATKTDPQA